MISKIRFNICLHWKTSVYNKYANILMLKKKQNPKNKTMSPSLDWSNRNAGSDLREASVMQGAE